MTLDELANMACKELPQHWELEITLELGHSQVVLYSPLGEHCHEANDITSFTLEEQVNQAITYAKDHAADF